MTSETSLCRERLAPYCTGWGLDIGFGGDPINPNAITLDLPKPYTQVGEARQILRGYANDLGFICDDALDFIFSSHLLEDFSYVTCRFILREWWRVLRPGGRLVIYCPDQARYAAHCEKTGQPQNLHHMEKDFSLRTFREFVLGTHVLSFDWQEIHAEPAVDTYSWELVAEKVKR